MSCALGRGRGRNIKFITVSLQSILDITGFYVITVESYDPDILLEYVTESTYFYVLMTKYRSYHSNNKYDILEIIFIQVLSFFMY